MLMPSVLSRDRACRPRGRGHSTCRAQSTEAARLAAERRMRPEGPTWKPALNARRAALETSEPFAQPTLHAL